jgi:hypothetical protein
MTISTFYKKGETEMSETEEVSSIRVKRINMYNLSKHQLIHPENDFNHQFPFCVVCGKKPNFGNHKDVFWTATLVRPDIKTSTILDYCCDKEECLMQFSQKAILQKLKRLKDEQEQIEKDIKFITEKALNEKKELSLEVVVCLI